MDSETLILAMLAVRAGAADDATAERALAWLAQQAESDDIEEGCIPNRSGPGHHDDQTGRPCSPDGGSDTALSHEKANSRLPDHSRPRLGDTERAAIRDYTSSYYKHVNTALRKGGSMGHPQLAAIHEGLQRAFAATEPFPQPITVRRGLTFEDEKQLDTFLGAMKKAKGKGTVRMPGYSSTTTDERHAFQGNVELVIAAKKGIDARPFSIHADENELLLDHDSAFRVIGVKKDGKRWLIQMEQILSEKSESRWFGDSVADLLECKDGACKRLEEVFGGDEWRSAFQFETDDGGEDDE